MRAESIPNNDERNPSEEVVTRSDDNSSNINNEPLTPPINRNSLRSKLKRILKPREDDNKTLTNIVNEQESLSEKPTIKAYLCNYCTSTNALFIIFILQGLFTLICGVVLLYLVGTGVLKRNIEYQQLQTQFFLKEQIDGFVKSIEQFVDFTNYYIKSKTFNANNPLNWFVLFRSIDSIFSDSTPTAYMLGRYDDTYMSRGKTFYYYDPLTGFMNYYNITDYNVNSIASLFNNSRITQSVPSDYRCTKTPWYIPYTKPTNYNTMATWSELFLNINNSSAISLSIPLYSNVTIDSLPEYTTRNYSYVVSLLDLTLESSKKCPPHLYGIFGIQLNLNTVQSVIAESLTGGFDNMFIINSNSIILANSSSYYARANGLQDKLFEEVMKRNLTGLLKNCNSSFIISENSNITRFTFDYKQYTYYCEFDSLCLRFGLDWGVVTLLRTSNLFSTIIENDMTSLVAFIIFFIVAIIVLFVIVQFLSTLIKRESRTMNDLIQLNSLYDDKQGEVTRLFFFDINQIESSIKRLRKLFRLFSQYVPPMIVKKIINGEDQYDEIGMRKQYLTIMHISINGLDKISDLMDGKNFSEMASDYYAMINDGIKDSGGIVEEYFGENVISIFNETSFPILNHEKSACEAALNIVQGINELNEKWKREELSVVIGINCGSILFGNLGSRKRMNMTCVGFDVDISLKLRYLNTYFKTNILISDTIYEQVKDVYICYFIDFFRFRDDEHMIPIYSLISRRDDGNDLQRKIEKDLLVIQQLMSEKKFERMIDACQKILNLEELHVIRHLLCRAQSLQNNIENAKVRN
ncbi:hypothetical protein ABK040_008444 [Willaertia magna]